MDELLKQIVGRNERAAVEGIQNKICRGSGFDLSEVLAASEGLRPASGCGTPGVARIHPALMVTTQLVQGSGETDGVQHVDGVGRGAAVRRQADIHARV